MALLQNLFRFLALLALVPPAYAQGNPALGARVFGQCMACHSVRPGEHMTGPSLASVWNAKAGSAKGFRRYSEAIEKSGVVWNAETLDRWLGGPEALIPGTSMTFPGLKDAQARRDVIAYLKAVAGGKAPQAQGGGGIMGMMRNDRPDLGRAPAEGQVISIRHCGDTYVVATADGKTQKVWEFNLRFKTDSSKLGPLPGKPVVIGAGMQGDRASVIFSAPEEISAFIKQSCA